MTPTVEIRIKPVEPPPPQVQGLLGLHRWAGGWPNPDGMPIVMPPVSYKKVMMTEAIQWISYKIANTLNSAITPKVWHSLHDDDRVHTNFVGFNPQDDHAKRDYVNNLGIGSELPAYDKPFRFGGGQFMSGLFEKKFRIASMVHAFISIVKSGANAQLVRNTLPNLVRPNTYVFQAGVHGIDAATIRNSFSDSNDMQDYTTKIAKQAIANGWYVLGLNGFDATQYVEHFAQGKGDVVAFPFIFAGEIEFYSQYIIPWNSDETPNPLKLYYP